jgi:photosystem II stability/assembly factor-like uncharacterized protein
LVSPGKTLFAGTATGLWRSLDNGHKWAKIKLGAGADTAVNALAPDGTNIFVGTGGNGVLVSTDDGKTWKAFNEGLTNRHILALVNYGGRLFAGTKGGGIFMTPLVADANLPPSAKPQTVTLDEDTSIPIRRTGEDPEDKPVTFKILVWPQKGSLTGDAPDLRYTPLANFFGTDSFIFITHDGKASSRIAVVTINVKPVDDPLELTISGDDSSVVGRLVVLSAQGLDPEGGAVKVSAKLLPQGAVFEQLHGPSLGLAKWVPTAEGTQPFIFTVTQDNGASLTKEFKVNVTSPRPTNGWSLIPLFIDKYAREVLLDGATIYIVAEGVGSDRSTVLLGSTDNGRHWTRIGAGLVSKHPYSIINSGKALFAATSESIFRSTDGGLNWVNVSGGKGLPEDGKKLFVAALGDKALAWSSRKVFLSLDAGGGWSDVTSNLPIGSPDAPSLDSRLINKATVSGNALLVSLYANPATPNGPFTFRSANDGANWQAANSGLEGPSSINRFVADKDTLYSLTAFHTHHSGDHGARWRVLNPLFSNGRIGVFPNINAAARNATFSRALVSGPWKIWLQFFAHFA